MFTINDTYNQTQYPASPNDIIKQAIYYGKLLLNESYPDELSYYQQRLAILTNPKTAQSIKLTHATEILESVNLYAKKK